MEVEVHVLRALHVLVVVPRVVIDTPPIQRGKALQAWLQNQFIAAFTPQRDAILLLCVKIQGIEWCV